MSHDPGDPRDLPPPSPSNDRLNFDRRLRRLERLLTVLVAVSGLQAALLAVIAIGDFLPSLFKVIVFVALLIGFIVLFRKQIPRWFGSLSRVVFSQLDND